MQNTTYARKIHLGIRKLYKYPKDGTTAMSSQRLVVQYVDG